MLDATADEVIEAIASLHATSRTGVGTAYALHVGGLNQLVQEHAGYTAGLQAADVVYADGAAVVLLARAAGARRIGRAPTTDIGIPTLKRLGAQFGRAPRVALIGGPPGLAERAGRVLESQAGVVVAFATDGFRTDDEAIADALHRAAVDVVIVGKGVPLEVIWVERMRPLLPPCIVLTCGGWFGFLVGDERRAPALLQTLHLEWAHRLVLAPRRLGVRYATGAWTTLRLLWRQARAPRHPTTSA